MPAIQCGFFHILFCHCSQSYNFICDRHPQWALAMPWNLCWTVGSICRHTYGSSRQYQGWLCPQAGEVGTGQEVAHMVTVFSIMQDGVLICILHCISLDLFEGEWHLLCIKQVCVCVYHMTLLSRHGHFSLMLQYCCCFHKPRALPSCQFCSAAWHIQCFGALWHWIGHLAIRWYHFSFNNCLVNSLLPIVNRISKLGPPTLLLYIR